MRCDQPTNETAQGIHSSEIFAFHQNENASLNSHIWEIHTHLNTLQEPEDKKFLVFHLFIASRKSFEGNYLQHKCNKPIWKKWKFWKFPISAQMVDVERGRIMYP